MKKLLIIISTVFLISCSESALRLVGEESVINKIEMVNSPKIDYTYWVVTPHYNFYTNTLYTVGDTLHITKK